MSTVSELFAVKISSVEHSNENKSKYLLNLKNPNLVCFSVWEIFFRH